MAWMERSGFVRRACDVERERRDTDDSCMMDGEAMERIASVLPAIRGGSTSKSFESWMWLEWKGELIKDQKFDKRTRVMRCYFGRIGVIGVAGSTKGIFAPCCGYMT